LRGISEGSAEFLISSLSSSSIKQYDVHLKEWISYCSKETISPYKFNIEELLNYLQQQFDKGLSYSSLNTCRSALSLISQDVDGYPIGQHPITKRFMKAVYKKRPNNVKYKSLWDPSPVLQFLEQMFPLETLTLEKLTLKLVVLLSLATGHRVQTFSQMKINDVHAHKEGIEVFISSLIKSSGPKSQQPCLYLPYFQEKPALCVASTFKAYVERTASIRSENLKVISYKKPHKPVSSQTISRWIKSVLLKSGIDSSFTAHSTRHVSTSLASLKGIDLNQIKETAGWSSKSNVFFNFYKRPVKNKSSFATAVIMST